MGCRPVVDEIEPELDGSGLGSAIAVIFFAAIAVSLAVLPAATALGVLDLRVGWVGDGLGALGFGLVGVKLIAMAWAMRARQSGARLANEAITASE